MILFTKNSSTMRHSVKRLRDESNLILRIEFLTRLRDLQALNLRDLGSASFDLEGWLGSLLPALLMATILNWYSFPFWIVLIDALVRFESTVSQSCHSSSSPLILDSMWYPVMGTPPSSRVSDHSRSICLSDQSTIDGAPGGRGIAIDLKRKV